MIWKLPPKIKIYEALGCIGDGRINVTDNDAEVYSSSGGKRYIVKYDSEKNAIMANDNASYWAGYLGYPSISFLMAKGLIKFDNRYSEALKGIQWKDINVKFRNNYEKTESYIKEMLRERNVDIAGLEKEVDSIYNQIKNLRLEKLGKRIAPPKGY